MNPLKRVFGRFRSGPPPVSRVTPPPHEHDFSGMWLPTDMGRKEVTSCRVDGCYEPSVRVAADQDQYREVGNAAQDMIDRLTADVERKLR